MLLAEVLVEPGTNRVGGRVIDNLPGKAIQRASQGLARHMTGDQLVRRETELFHQHAKSRTQDVFDQGVFKGKEVTQLIVTRQVGEGLLQLPVATGQWKTLDTDNGHSVSRVQGTRQSRRIPGRHGVRNQAGERERAPTLGFANGIGKKLKVAKLFEDVEVLIGPIEQLSKGLEGLGKVRENQNWPLLLSQSTNPLNQRPMVTVARQRKGIWPNDGCALEQTGEK